MSQAKFAAAKELIVEKHFDAARAVLETIDDPKANQWLANLDKIAPLPEAEFPIMPLSTARSAQSLQPEVIAARQKSYTNAAVVVLILYFVLWLPGLIANIMYLSDAKRMQELARIELPGVKALYWERLLLATLPLLALLIGAIGLVLGLVIPTLFRAQP